MREFVAQSKIGLEIVESKEENGIIKEIFLADEVGDKYHTLHELYQHRMALNAALFNMLAAVNHPDIIVVKSKLHNDGTMFEGDYFVVCWKARDCQITYHYKLKHWDKFKIPVVERIPWKYDGHTSEDVIKNLLNF